MAELELPHYHTYSPVLSTSTASTNSSIKAKDSSPTDSSRPSTKPTSRSSSSAVFQQRPRMDQDAEESSSNGRCVSALVNNLETPSEIPPQPSSLTTTGFTPINRPLPREIAIVQNEIDKGMPSIFWGRSWLRSRREGSSRASIKETRTLPKDDEAGGESEEVSTNRQKVDRATKRKRQSTHTAADGTEDNIEKVVKITKKAKISLKKSKTTVKIEEEEEIKSMDGRLRKKWLKAGMYVGQQRGFDPGVPASKNKEKLSAEVAPTERTYLPMPMFAGEELLEKGRDFKLPYDVYAPLQDRQPKPDEWKKIQKNRFIGDAATEWKKAKKLPASKCLCDPDSGCGEDCQNRFMYYECDDSNCSVGAEHCTNRAFATLKERVKMGNKYDVGVEIVKTPEKGFGVRSCRTFEPNQIIVEYFGEIITQDECERRMTDEYKNNECYYLMTFDQNMIIDATRGSIARFVNHSCEPNCRMVKWTVNGQPRMALFAGDNGIMTGDELTYDYNFDPFSQKNVQECRCGTPSCRGFLGPRPNKDRADALKQANIAKAAKQAKACSSTNIILKRAAPTTSKIGNFCAGAKRKINDYFTSSSSSKENEDGPDQREVAVLKKRRISKPANSDTESSSAPLLPIEQEGGSSRTENKGDKKPIKIPSYILGGNRRHSSTAKLSAKANKGTELVQAGSAGTNRHTTIGGTGGDQLRQYKGWAWIDRDEPAVVLEKDRPTESVKKGGRSLRKKARTSDAG